jgi:hypothetical protein
LFFQTSITGNVMMTTPKKPDQELPPIDGEPVPQSELGAPDNVARFPGTSTPLTSSVVDRFRLTSANATATTREVVTTCKIMKPKADMFFRTHPDQMQELVLYVFPQKDGDVPISPAVFDLIKAKVTDFHKFAPCVALRPATTPTGGVFLMPLKMESPDSVGSNSWNISAFTIADRARGEWLRMSSNQGMGMYTAILPDDEIPEPDWAKVPHIFKLFEMVVKYQEITGLDHPLIKPFYKVKG